VYDGSPLNGPDVPGMPVRTRPGAPAVDAPQGDGWLLDRLGNRFQLLAIAAPLPSGLDTITVDDIAVEPLEIEINDAVRERYLGAAESGFYLLRPDQHVGARWCGFDRDAVVNALRGAIGKG